MKAAHFVCAHCIALSPCPIPLPGLSPYPPAPISSPWPPPSPPASAPAFVPSGADSTRARGSVTALLLSGDFFVGTSLAVTLVKLALRFGTLNVDKAAKNRLHAEVCV